MKFELATENVSKLNPICFEVSLWSQKQPTAGYEERCMGSYRICWGKGKARRGLPLLLRSAFVMWPHHSLPHVKRQRSVLRNARIEQRELVFPLNPHKGYLSWHRSRFPSLLFVHRSQRKWAVPILPIRPLLPPGCCSWICGSTSRGLPWKWAR